MFNLLRAGISDMCPKWGGGERNLRSINRFSCPYDAYMEVQIKMETRTRN